MSSLELLLEDELLLDLFLDFFFDFDFLLCLSFLETLTVSANELSSLGGRAVA